MQELRANTAVDVRVGPFVDVGDGFTPQTDIGDPGTNLAGVDEAELLKHNGAATVDLIAGNNLWAVVAGCRGWYDLTLSTDDTDTEGILDVVVQDDSDCLPVGKKFMVLSQAAWDSKYVAKDTGFMDINVKAVSEDTTAADNLEAILDGTGGTGLSLDSIVVTGAATGISVTGTTQGVLIQGGTTGKGLVVEGGGTSGYGAEITSTSGAALVVNATSGAAVDITASAGIGIDIGASTSGITVDCGAGAALHLAGTTYGMELTASAGPGLSCVSTGGDGDGIVATKHGTGYDINGTLTVCTTNTDMVGTTGANTTVPDAAGVVATALGDGTVVLAGAYDAAKTAATPAEANAACDTALSDINLDHLLKVADADDVVDDSVIGKMASIDGDWSKFAKATDSLQAIRDRGDAEWLTGAGGAPPNLLQSTTIATLATQTSFTLTAGSADDDAYNNAYAVVTDSVTAEQKAVCEIADYTGGTLTVTLASDPGIFTMAAGDGIKIVSSGGKSVADALGDELLADHTTAGTFGAALGKANQIGTSTITISSPVATDGDITLHQYDDYDADETRSLEWTNSDGDWGPDDITDATVEFVIRDQNGVVKLTADGVVVTPTTTQKVRVELTNLETADLDYATTYEYQLRLILDTTERQETIAVGNVTVTTSGFES